MNDVLVQKDITDKVIKAFYYFYNKLGYGFLEKVYENAMVITLAKYGCDVAQQIPVKVYFEGEIIGDYYADLVVDNYVIVELKAGDSITEAYEAQLTNYLKATDIEVGLLLNFGIKPEFRRKVFTKSIKK
jgi:GxxExxY protein